MKRVAILLLVASVTALAPATVNAQGLFGLPGLPSFGGTWGASRAAEKSWLRFQLEALCRWMEDREGTSINVNTTGILIGNVASVGHHFSNRGLWLGLGNTTSLSDRVAFIASGWYLVPSTATLANSTLEPSLPPNAHGTPMRGGGTLMGCSPSVVAVV